MEPQARYDLNAAIKGWRAELAAQPGLTPDNRLELEAHLRDAILGFQQRGLNDEESFWLACKRVGQPSQLGEEFVKANPNVVWRERVFWMSMACLIVDLWGSSLNLIANLALTSSNSIASLANAMLYVSILRLFFFYLPILACAMMFASGRLDFNQSKLLALFRSRFLLVVATTLWVLANCSVLLYHIPQAMNDNSYTAHASWAVLLGNVFNTMIWPFLLIALTVWLMPKKNQKTPKHA